MERLSSTLFGVIVASAVVPVALTGTVSASVITWQAPQNITGASDVSTVGSYFGSWAPYNGGANTEPVNGVTFQGNPDLPNLTVTQGNDGGGQDFSSAGTPNANYNTLLSYATFSFGENYVFSWNGMTPGHEYEVEFWVSDPRNLGQTRSETITGTSSDTSEPLLFPADGTGVGQYVIGTFAADATGSMTLTVSGFSTSLEGPSAQINLVEVREVPEPSSIVAFCGLGVVGLFLVVRRRRASQI
jgi:hypothetical protein